MVHLAVCKRISILDKHEYYSLIPNPMNMNTNIIHNFKNYTNTTNYTNIQIYSNNLAQIGQVTENSHERNPSQ